MYARTMLCGVVAAAMFGFAGAAGADTVVSIFGTESQENTGVGFTGSIAYDSAAKDVTVTLTNTSSLESVLTGFVFNIDADVTASYDAANDASTAGVDEGAWAFETSNTVGQSVTGPFGVWDAGAALLVLSQQQIRGVNTGETGIFRFLLSGPEAGLLTTESFTTKFNTADGLSSFFLARFQSVGGEDSDRMVAGVENPPQAVPLPAAAWGGLALIGGLGAARRFRRRREESADVA